MSPSEHFKSFTFDSIATFYHFASQCPEEEVVRSLELRTEMKKCAHRNGEEPRIVYALDTIRHTVGSILANKSAVERWIFWSYPLISAHCSKGIETKGTVAYNVTFFLHDEYQNKGIGALIYRLEEKLFREIGVQEIQMAATLAGKFVWPRKFQFKLFCDDYGLIEHQYRDWCGENATNYVPIWDVNSYPKKFLDRINQLRLYKELN